jgi:hypothetical protein
VGRGVSTIHASLFGFFKAWHPTRIFEHGNLDGGWHTRCSKCERKVDVGSQAASTVSSIPTILEPLRFCLASAAAAASSYLMMEKHSSSVDRRTSDTLP